MCKHASFGAIALSQDDLAILIETNSCQLSGYDGSSPSSSSRRWPWGFSIAQDWQRKALVLWLKVYYMTHDPLAGYPSKRISQLSNGGRAKPRKIQGTCANFFGAQPRAPAAKRSASHQKVKPMKLRAFDLDMPGGQGRRVEQYMESIVETVGCSASLFSRESFVKKSVQNCWLVANGIDPNSSGSEAPVITKNFTERMTLKLKQWLGEEGRQVRAQACKKFRAKKLSEDTRRPLYLTMESDPSKPLDAKFLCGIYNSNKARNDRRAPTCSFCDNEYWHGKTRRLDFDIRSASWPL